MAKKVSVILIIAACCVGLGIALLAVSSAFWGGSPRNWYDNPQTLTETFDNVDDLRVAVANNLIELRRGGDTVTVEWEERYPDEYDITVSGGRLEIEQNSSNNRWGWSWFRFDFGWFQQWRGFDSAPTRITVTVPEDADLRSADVALANGSVTFYDFACGEFSMEAANGTVQGTLDAPDIELGGANLMGELTVPEGTLKDTRISMDSVNGRLDVNGETIGRGVLNSVETGSGSRRISVAMVNGSVDVTDN